MYVYVYVYTLRAGSTASAAAIPPAAEVAGAIRPGGRILSRAGRMGGAGRRGGGSPVLIGNPLQQGATGGNTGIPLTKQEGAPKISAKIKNTLTRGASPGRGSSVFVSKI